MEVCRSVLSISRDSFEYDFSSRSRIIKPFISILQERCRMAGQEIHLLQLLALQQWAVDSAKIDEGKVGAENLRMASAISDPSGESPPLTPRARCTLVSPTTRSISALSHRDRNSQELWFRVFTMVSWSSRNDSRRKTGSFRLVRSICTIEVFSQEPPGWATAVL